MSTTESPQAKAAFDGITGASSARPKFPRPEGVSRAAVLMQAPGGTPHWIEPGNIAAAKAAGAEAVQ